ncbi:MAG TPA: STAS domain-containing protein [Symbiobacteriaceae bacterium]|nr:STAS domain-containing protein [Symbiobacteriaceae bacterium]
MIEALEVEGATVLFLAGELDTVSCVTVRELVAGLMADGRRLLVLDLSGLQRVYAAGLSLLLDLHRVASQYGARLICCGARPFVREVLRITMLDRAIDLQLDLDGALDLLSAAS